MHDITAINITAVNNDRPSHGQYRFSRRTFLRTVGMGLALGLPLAACQPVPTPMPSPVETPTPGAEPAVELLFWHQLSQQEQGALDALLGQFHETEPAIRVNPMAIPRQEFRARMLAAYAAGELPNVAQVDAVPDGADFYVKGMLAEADFIFEEEGLDREDFLDHVLDANRMSATLPYGDALTGIPLDAWPVAAIYNQAHLEASGLVAAETLAEFVEVAIALTDDDGERWGFPLGDVGYPPSLVFAILGAQFFLAGVGDHAEIPAAKWVLDALYDDQIDDEIEGQISPRGAIDPVELFLQERGSILWGSTGVLQRLEQNGSVDLLTTMTPAVDSSAFATSATLRSLSLSSMQDEEHLRAGARLIKFLSDSSAELLSPGAGLPTRQTEIEALQSRFGELGRDPALWNPFIESLLAMKADQFVTPIVTDSLFTNELDRVWAREVSATDAITSWNAQFSENAESGHAPARRNTAGAVHNISFNQAGLLAPLPQRYSIQGCCFMNWLPWCC